MLDRFEIILESGPATDATGIAALLVYDISSGHTVNLSPATKGAFVRNEVLWWATGAEDTTIWHSVDLRTA